MKALLVASLVLPCAVVTVAAQAPAREWQTGTWGTAAAARGQGGARTHLIETADFQYQVQEAIGRGVQPLDVTAGEAITFAVEKETVYIRETATSERPLRLIKSTRKLKTYASPGTGHYIRAIGEGGKTITLEDGSVWETEPGTQYEVGVQWESLAGITVRANDELEGFNYFLDNTDLDRGTMARLASGQVNGGK